MKRGNTLIIVTIVVVAVALFFVFRGSDEEGAIKIEEIDLSDVVTHSVVLTEDGYVPNEIEIQEGEAIIFSTTAGNLFWPASNIHPSHTIYSEFDPQVPISPDETWAFIFNEVGSWEYHDHLNPIYRGVVRVLPN